MERQNDGGERIDESLVRAAAAGSLAAFDALVERYRRAVLVTAARIVRSWDVAEEVAQDAFVLAYTHLRTLRDPAGFPAWLRAIARRRALRVVADEGRSDPAEPCLLEKLVAARSQAFARRPDAVLAERERLRGIIAVLNGLPDHYSEPIVLFHGEHWPVRRIAAYLGLPESTVKWRLHHGRRIAAARLAAREETQDEQS